MRKLELYELTTCKKLEDAFGMIAEKKKWDTVDFCNKCLSSSTLDQIASYDAIIGQSKTYIYNNLVNELQNITEPSDTPIHKPSLEWFGFLILYWIFSAGIDPKDILKYDISSIINEYDILHTYSMKNAIKDIQENLVVR